MKISHLLLSIPLLFAPIVAFGVELCTHFDKDFNSVRYRCDDRKPGMDMNSILAISRIEEFEITAFKKRFTPFVKLSAGFGAVAADINISDYETTMVTNSAIFVGLGAGFRFTPNRSPRWFYDFDIAAHVENVGGLGGDPIIVNDGTNSLDVTRQVLSESVILSVYAGYRLLPELSLYAGAGLGPKNVTVTYPDFIDSMMGWEMMEATTSHSVVDARLALGVEHRIGDALALYAEFSLNQSVSGDIGADAQILWLGARAFF